MATSGSPQQGLFGAAFSDSDDSEICSQHSIKEYKSWGSLSSQSSDHIDLASAKKLQTGGTLLGATVNLTNVAIGSGLLAFPYVFHETGILTGIFLLITLAILMGFLAEMISKVCYTIHQQAPGVYLTYEIMVDLVLGRIMAVVIMICVMISVIAAQIALLIVIGDMLEPIVQELFYPDYEDSWWTTRAAYTAFVALIVIFPLCILKKIDTLRWTSGLAVLSLLFIAAIVVGYCLNYFITDNDNNFVNETARGEIRWLSFTTGIFAAIPIMTYSLAFHIQIPPIYQELEYRTAHY
jgi:amino acid permease